jgi:hypothetical protein
VNQVDNLQAGDIVIFIDDVTGVPRDIMGFVVDDNFDPNDEQAVLIQFFGKDDGEPLHYYRRELDDYLESGEIRIQHA